MGGISFAHVNRRAREQARTSIVQVAGDVTGPAADVRHEPAAASLFREAGEKMSVERLAIELRRQVLRVRFRRRVIAVAHVHRNRACFMIALDLVRVTKARR